MNLQKLNLRLIVTVTILILTTICALEMTTGRSYFTSSPMYMTVFCSHCSAIGQPFRSISGTVNAIIIFLGRAILASVAVFGTASILIHYWRSHHFAVAIRTLRLRPIPARLARISSKVQPAGNIDVVPSSEPLAFCYGLLRPRTCVSTGLIDFLFDSELKAVLCHEHHHQKIGAPLILFAADSLAKVFFFIPVLSDVRNLLAAYIERSADRYAVRMTGRSTLARALYRLLNHPMFSPKVPYPAGVGLSVTSVRIAELLGERTPQRKFSLLSVGSSIVIILGIICLMWPDMIF